MNLQVLSMASRHHWRRRAADHLTGPPSACPSSRVCSVDKEDDNLAILAESIIAREFKRNRPSTIDLRVVVDVADETIEILADGVAYKMCIGSDDDSFRFESQCGDIISYGFPQDWLDLIDDA